jgi:ribonucleoside-diphosphate reductase alpha chain
MGVLRCDHPDIVEFVRAKDDLSRWTNYNVSVAATDEWMRQAQEAPDSRLVVVNPRNGRKAWLRKSSGRRVSMADYEAYAAGEPAPGAEYWTYGGLFSLIIHYAWKNGEPGLLFLDRANSDNQVPQLGDYEASNPCVTGDTWVLTREGPRMVGELLGRPIYLAVQGEWAVSSARGFFATGTREVLRLRTTEGHELRLTADHRVRRVLRRGAAEPASEWVAAQDLREGDEILLHDHRDLPPWSGEGTQQEGWLLGMLVGDGNLRQQAADLSVWAAPMAAGGLAAGPASLIAAADLALKELPHRADFIGMRPVAGRTEWRAGTASLRDLAARFGMIPGSKKPGALIERSSRGFHRGFLRGLFDTDGSVQGSQVKGVSVRLAQSDRETLRLAQRMLLRLGIPSSLYARRPAGAAILPDGRGGSRAYPTAAQWELVITRENLFTFADKIGFTDAAKADRLRAALGAFKRTPNQERFTARFASLEPAGVEEVFDVQVPDLHAFDANGLVAHNCGEQLLLPYGSCNLGSINLARFGKSAAPAAAPWEERFDWEAFEDAVADSVRFLDDVVSINRFPVDEIRQRAEQERRIGLGVMGFADLLYQLGVRYGSPASYEVARRLATALSAASVRASEALVAKDGRAPFGAWEGSRPQSEGRPARRNSYLTTVAPTGTISIIAGCSGGIEPLFSLAFRRQVMKDADGKPVEMIEVNPEFRAALERAGLPEDRIQSAVAHALEHGTIQGIGLPAAIEEVFVTAHDVPPEQHVRMQAAWQTSIDNAVSKTINLPHEAAEEDVRAAYLLAWKESCKGVTVYRDGCRALQPMALGTGAPAAAATAATAAPPPGTVVPARLPEIMPGVRIRQSTPFGNMHVKISVEPKSGREMEVFAQLGKGGDLANSDLEAICRMVSLYLRVGGSLEDVIKQLAGIGSTLSVPTRDGRILSLADGLAMALRKWRAAKERFGARAILLGEADLSEVQGEEVPRAAVSYKIRCPACEAGTLIFEEGCCKCPGCGYSQC